MASKYISGGDKLEAHLRKLAEKVSAPATLEVGFLEGATYPDGTSVPMVAAINEFGAPSRGQPPRPYFRNMVKKESRHWGSDVGNILRAQNFDAKATLEVMGEEIKGELRQSIRDLKSPPLKPSTIARKGFDKPLIDTGHLLNSIDHEVVSGDVE